MLWWSTYQGYKITSNIWKCHYGGVLLTVIHLPSLLRLEIQNIFILWILLCAFGFIAVRPSAQNDGRFALIRVNHVSMTRPCLSVLDARVFNGKLLTSFADIRLTDRGQSHRGDVAKNWLLCGAQVDFKEFIQGVSQFSVKGDKLSKLRFAFRIYDMDNDGYISNGELFQVTIVNTNTLNLHNHK